MPERERDADDLFVRILSHQMKTPVNAVRSLLQAVVENRGEEMSPAVREALERAIHRAGEAGRLVDDLLEYERFGERRLGEMREVELAALLTETAHRFSLAAAGKDVALSLSLPPGLEVYLQGSRTAMEHALRNLVDNAIKYTPALGRVELSLAVDRRARSLAIAVRDSGGGIPAEEIPDLFTPFFRSKRRAISTGGTGLGLAIAHRIIEAHGGTIDVESPPGEGTTFTIRLPFARLERVERARSRGQRVVIVGGVTSGPKAAARLRRLDENLEITIIERNEFLAYAGCQLPSYISDAIGSSKDSLSGAYRIMRTAHFFEAMRNITILNMTEAVRIDRAARKVTARSRADGTIREIPYDTLILATGSLPVIPPIPGAVTDLVLPLHSLEDARRIRERLASRGALDVLVVGGGLIGISAIQALLDCGARITVVEREETILRAYFDEDFSRRIEQGLRLKGVKLVTRAEITSISPASGGVAANAGERTLTADFIILASGMTPNVELARACGLELGAAGGIKVDEHLATSDPSVFAIGDCAETRHLVSGEHELWPLGSVSVKMGRIAADAVGGRGASFAGSLGTVLLQCAALRMARTGLTSRRAGQIGYDAVSFVVSGGVRPGYGRPAGESFLKVIVDRKTRRLLGAQAFGAGEVETKISLLAAAITAGLTTDEVFRLDLGHSPDVNLPIDITQGACLMANNKIDGLVRTITAEELDAAIERPTLVAVATPEEGSRFLIPGSIEINPENLRRMEMPFREDEELVLYSETSQEAYHAYRYLAQSGFKRLRLLEGGYLFWAALR